MKAKDHVLNLLSHGFKFDTVARLNESQVRVLSEKISKEENKEQVQQKQTTVTLVGTKGGVVPVKPGQTQISLKPVANAAPGTMEVVEDDTLNIVNDPDATKDGMGIFEKFESKSQQRLFYSRCGNGKTKTEKKWCNGQKNFLKKLTMKQHLRKKKKMSLMRNF